MRRNAPGALLHTLLLFATPLAGQTTLGPRSALDAIDWRVPIHTQSEDPAFGDYGVWAAGRGYKVSFHDGMCFYPVLGADAPRHQPLRWTTRGVRLGELEILPDRATYRPHHDAWRFEYRFAGVTEAYDVRPDGVEQSFVVARPAALGGAAPLDGDLVVTGQWGSSLQPVRDAVPGSARSELHFVDQTGRELVRYGGAIALDAAGRRTDVSTAVWGDAIRLIVPAAWVRTATWPITIDPLLCGLAFDSAGLGRPQARHRRLARRSPRAPRL
ncbi:MAG: hypothetical protein AAF628_12180 [Planctomycetota bacterium]